MLPISHQLIILNRFHTFFNFLRDMPTLDLVQLFNNFVVISVGFIYVIRGRERKKQYHYQAWQVINSAYGQKTSGGRIDALQDLAKDRVSLAGLNIEGASLPRIKLRQANLRGANLSKADLRAANLSKANLDTVSLTKADLREANLEGASLNGADLSEANLSKANLKKVVLHWALLNRTDLREADLREANLSLDIGKTVLRKNWGFVVRQTNLTTEDLLSLGLEQSGANLEGADLRKANLEGANLEGANLKGANLEGANLKGVKCNSETILPTGFGCSVDGWLEKLDDRSR